MNQCPTDWEAEGDHCYRFFNTLTTWENAHHECVSYSCSTLNVRSDLVSVHSAAEQAYVFNYWRGIDSQAGQLWIGLYDKYNEGDFIWTDGSKVGYTKWAGGEPNNHNNAEDYGQFRHTEGGAWNDNSAAAQAKYMCKLTFE
nr:Chain A, Lectin CEL-I, N-acetyl-D-galactosamine-specific C-type [Cucumaria echinata]4WQQ_B Chain B, Lectin CEL-I, N-acetyl-D-galactosamine-specific C-type [Cucumaria echinata]4WQQ_C Chain C, Lectin CEL-I, N-acetyl-D-galactosamine-specific C-type [Cucumaria echinata]4WQQ_D Chain D, Lectin CEL-I, N-acetyl-D-galactosamine-specific C-type [Cucumaria echinata]